MEELGEGPELDSLVEDICNMLDLAHQHRGSAVAGYRLTDFGSPSGFELYPTVFHLPPYNALH